MSGRRRKDETDIVVGARVKAGTKKGTVKFVGKVDFNKGPSLWVGIELDEPLGKHDGIVKGKRYFKCKPKCGTMTKIAKVELLKEKKRDRKKASEPKSPERTGRKDRSKKGQTTPVRTRVQYDHKSTQTDEIEEKPPEKGDEQMKLDRENLELLHEMQEMADARKDRLTQEVGELQKRIRELEAENQEFRNLKDEAVSQTHLLQMEKETLEQDNEFLQIDMEELQAKFELLELDIELLKENEENLRQDIIEELTGDTQEIAINIEERNQMEAALEKLKEAFATEVRQRDFKIVHLEGVQEKNKELQSEVRELSHELSELKQVLVEKNSEISELKSDIDLLSDSMDMVENLVEKNLTLEQAKQTLQEEVDFLAESLELQEELGADNEIYQEEILIQLDMQVEEISALEEEIQDLQQALFQTKNKIGRLEDSRVTLGRAQEESFDAKQQHLSRIQDLTEENLRVRAALEDFQADVIAYEKIAAQEQQTEMRLALTVAHIPSSVKMDDMMIDFLLLLERASGKSTALRNVCDRLYLHTVNHGFEPEECMAARSIFEDALVVESCLQVIVTGIVALSQDKFEAVLVSWRQLLGLDDKLDFVLDQIQQKNLGTYSPDDMQECVKVCTEFVTTHFAGQNPLKLRKEGKCTKVHVNHNINTVLLKLFDMREAYVKTNSTMVELSTETATDTQWFTEAQQVLDAELQARGEDEMGVEPTKVQKLALDTSVFIKMDRLIDQILEQVKLVLDDCVVPLPNYGDGDLMCKQILDQRSCLVGFNMIAPCVERASKCVQSLRLLHESVDGVDRGQKFNDRVLAINHLLQPHSRVHPEGLVSILEELYYLVQNVLQGLRSVAAFRDDNDVRAIPEKLKTQQPIWTIKAAETRTEIESASKVREELEESQQVIKEKNSELFKSQKAERQSNGALSVLQKEISKLRTRQTKFSELEKEHSELMEKKERYKLEYAKQHEKAKDNFKQLMESKKEIKAKQEEVAKLTGLLKSNALRGKGSQGDLDFSRKQSFGFDTDRDRRSSTGVSKKEDGTPVTNAEAAKHIKVLEKTLNQLRTQVNTMNFKKKSEQLRNELKPLSFHKAKKELKGKDLEIEKNLNKLTQDLNSVWSAPSIVDISSPNKFFESSQRILKRQTSLQRIQRRGAQMKSLVLKEKAQKGMQKKQFSSKTQLVGKIEIPLAPYSINTDVIVDSQDLRSLYEVFVH